MKLAEVLKYHRALLGMSRSELSRVSGVDIKLIGRLEAGQKRANLDSLPKLLNALKVPSGTRLLLMGVTE